MNFKTIILRFRDLVTENGDTIIEHQNIIQKKKAVWWAWWRKGNEKTPITEFSILRTFAESNNINVYLLDSGQRKLYQAICNTVYFSPDEDTLSPKPDMTPRYYRTRKYAAWFHFSSIVECNWDEIRNFSYVQTDSLFLDSSINYSMFSNKRIYDLNELIQQNRTVWFVREYKTTDTDHEVILLNTNITEPNDFSTHYFEVKGSSLLWLSDLHNDNNPLFPVSKQKSPDRDTLTDHIRHSYNEFSDICGLLISGDITNQARNEGFAITQEFIEDLNRELRQPLSSQTIIFCPGNHDFSMSSSELREKSPTLLSICSENTKAYCDFYHKIHGKFPNQHFACGRKFLMASGRTVEIAALNSLTLQQYKDFEGHGYLSSEQLEFVAQEMGWNDSINTTAVRIAVMHHHYLPTCLVEKIDANKASSVVYDAERLMRWLKKYKVHILLHGHKHQCFSAVVNFPIQSSEKNYDFTNKNQTYIIGMGGTGADNCENMYAIIRFLTDSIKIDFYRIYSDNIREDRLDHTVTIPL